jgi:hypothetical protein
VRESAGEVDPYGLALDALKTAGLMPHPIRGYRAEETDSGEDIGVLEYEGIVRTCSVS